MNPYDSPTASLRRPWDAWAESANVCIAVAVIFILIAASCLAAGVPLLFGVIIGEPETLAEAVFIGVYQLLALPCGVFLLATMFRIAIRDAIAYRKCYRRRITYTIPSDRRVQRLTGTIR